MLNIIIFKIYKNKNNIEFNDNKGGDGEIKKDKKENGNIIELFSI